MNIPRPSKTFMMKVGEEDREIMMSYGLFNEIMRAVPKPDAIDQLLVSDPYLRDYVVRRVLTPARKVESEADLVDPFDLDVDIETLDELVGWVADHVLGFGCGPATGPEKFWKVSAGANPIEPLTEWFTQLTFADALSWTLGCFESDLDDYYWAYTYHELKRRIELKIGEVTASQLCTYRSLVEVASAAFGGKGENNPKADEDLTQLSPVQYQARVAALVSA